MATLEALKQSPQDLRGDAIVYLWDNVADVAEALGYHDQNNRGLPYGFVFTDLASKLGDPHWSVTLSHEVLEMVGDANVTTLAAGPHPKSPDRIVFHWYEMCDAVQAENYEIDGVAVSNFVLPLYFTVGEQIGARNDFLNRGKAEKSLRSFGIKEGGYIGFFDPDKKKHVQFSADEKGEARLRAKAVAGAARRGPRYGELVDIDEKVEHGSRLRPRPPKKISK
jgi:hypothetical protein